MQYATDPQITPASENVVALNSLSLSKKGKQGSVLCLACTEIQCVEDYSELVKEWAYCISKRLTARSGFLL